MSARSTASGVIAAVLGAAVLLLAGCAATPPPTTTAPSRLAATVAQSLKYPAQLVDCGTKKIAVVQGRVASCRLSETDKVYPIAVRFSKVTGTRYDFDARVAKKPSSTLERPASVAGTAVAGLAAQALAPKIGFAPQVSCVDIQVPLTAGFVERCGFPADDGDHVAEVTITAFDGANYSISAKVVS